MCTRACVHRCVFAMHPGVFLLGILQWDTFNPNSSCEAGDLLLALEIVPQPRWLSVLSVPGFLSCSMRPTPSALLSHHPNLLLLTDLLARGM